MISISSAVLPHRINLHDKNSDECVSFVCSSVTDLLSVWLLYLFISPHNVMQTDIKLVGMLFAPLGLPTDESAKLSWRDKDRYFENYYLGVA